MDRPYQPGMGSVTQVCRKDTIDRQLTRHLSAHVNYIYAFNGRFEEQSVHATPTMSYVSPWVTYRF